MRYRAVKRLLLAPKVVKPFLKEFLRIEIQRSGTAEHLGVSRPTQSFISLRAVCRHVKEVTSETPNYIVIKLLNKVVTASEIADSLHI